MTFEFRRFRLRVCFSFFALICLMLLCGGGTVALLCLAASLLHECGHLFFLGLFHMDVRQISFGAGGIVIERRGGCHGMAQEIAVALGGILVNLMLCACFVPWYAVSKNRICGVFCLVNGALAALNCLPVRTLDSYRVLELVLMRRSPQGAGRVLRRISLCAVCVITGVCVGCYCCGLGNPSLAAVCLYLMLLHWKTE